MHTQAIITFHPRNNETNLLLQCNAGKKVRAARMLLFGSSSKIDTSFLFIFARDWVQGPSYNLFYFNSIVTHILTMRVKIRLVSPN